MFKNLTNFSFKRNWKEAIGFYLAYFIVGLILVMTVAVLSVTLSGATTASESISIGLRVGAVVGIVYCLAIALLVLAQRKLYKNLGYVILVLLSAILAAVGGAFLGLIAPAFMTTRGASTTEASIE